MDEKTGESVATAGDLRLARYLGAALSGVTGVLYLLIGLGVLTVAETDIGGPGRGRILLGAAAVFFILAAGLVLLDRRYVYALGVAAQVVCIIGYFVIAPSRAPHFEEWGIIIKILQVVVLGALAYVLMVGRRRGGATV
jgi:hypothetical protein